MEWIAYLWMLFPFIGILVPLVIATHKFVLQPLIEAITRLAETRSIDPGTANDPRLRELEQNVAALEQSVKNILEEQAFQHELLRSLTAGGAQESTTEEGTVGNALNHMGRDAG